MNIAVIYGQRHKGNTWALTNLFLEKLKDEDTSGQQSAPAEFFLADESLRFCTGCLNCIMKGEEHCPHADYVQKIAAALDKADLIIAASPVYALNMTGQLKTLFDHLAYRYMVHRPEPAMFRKQAIALATAGGAGMGKTTKAICDNLFFWGIARIYRYGLRIAAADFEHIPVKRKQKIIRKVDRIVRKIRKNNGRARAGIKTKLIFLFSRLGQKHNDYSPFEKEYWQARGWLENERPF